MGRIMRVLSAAFVVTTALAVCPCSASAQQTSTGAPGLRAVSAIMAGTITGTVSDERGGPLPGAMVSVLGVTMAMTLTDASGRFSLNRLPIGEYTLRAHLAGFASSRRENVRVGPLASAPYRLQLRRLDGTAATSGRTDEAVTARPILAAGFALPAVESSSADSSDDAHSHSDTAWRLRHLTRSILKDSARTAVIADDTDIPADQMFTRKNGAAAGFAGSFLSDLPFSGEVNLLTTGAFAPGDLFSGDLMPRGVAYLSIGSPTPAGDWSLRAAMSEGDLSSWIVAGSFVSKRAGIHSYDLGYSYSTQEYQGGNPLALAAVTDGSRNVGEVSALDRWSFGDLTLEYGGRYARYDYLLMPGLFSPRVGLTLEPTKATRVTTVVAQRMIAPGAEEFLASAFGGPWLPPERTFSPLAGNDFRAERARYVDVLFEHDFPGQYSLGVRRFFQGIDNQAMTIFGMRSPSGTRSVGHYYVASAGSVDADGWSVRLRSSSSARVSGTIDYTLARGHWTSQGDLVQARPWLAALGRTRDEAIHDLTTSIQTDFPETATRVFLLYKLNSGYARRTPDTSDNGLDGRFDVQVNQALPFGVGNTKWEVLLGIRNLFRDPNDPASIYDELLVVRPPKRVVGGFLVRF
jgi:Carboxypeptidase regulatory-like domain